MNWDYIAGFVDGEGSFLINLFQRGDRIVFTPIIYPRITIDQKVKSPLEAIQKFVGAGYLKYTNGGEGRQIRYTLQFNGSKCWIIIKNLDGRLVLKQKHLEIMSEYLKVREYRIKNPLNYDAWVKELDYVQLIREANHFRGSYHYTSIDDFKQKIQEKIHYRE